MLRANFLYHQFYIFVYKKGRHKVQVNFLNSYYFPKVPTGRIFIKNATFPNFKGLDKDTFIKSDSENAFLKENKINFFNEIDNMFDKTYDTVLISTVKDNPILTNANIKKPKLEIMDVGNKNTEAMYNFAENSIVVSERLLKNDYYIVKSKVLSDDAMAPVIRNKSGAEKLIKDDSSLEAVKLSDKQKEIYINSILAHEIRHLIQYHLACSTKEGNESITGHYKRIKKQVDDYCNQMMQWGRTRLGVADKDLPFKKPDFSYAINFKPKEYISLNSRLKSRLSDDENKDYTAKDFVESIEASLESGQKTDYYSRLTEADAHHYQMEYFLLNNEFSANDDFSLAMFTSSMGL